MQMAHRVDKTDRLPSDLTCRRSTVLSLSPRPVVSRVGIVSLMETGTIE
jgi:hypothetical protein